MQTSDVSRFYSIRADANALGGFLEEPIPRFVPTLAPVSLPPVGGFAIARSEAFTLDNIVSCSSAYSRVTGQEQKDGSTSILVTAVVEGLNLLDAVEADRIVARLSIRIPPEKGEPIRVSTAGSRFEGLRFEGRRRDPRLNAKFEQLDSAEDTASLSASEIRPIGEAQAATVIKGFKDAENVTVEWLKKRFEWMTRSACQSGANLCSLVDGFKQPARRSCGHVVVIPDVGRIIFGELLMTPHSAQLVSIRAELGCPVKGKVTINCVGGGGVHDT